jgi:hypothetical protein
MKHSGLIWIIFALFARIISAGEYADAFLETDVSARAQAMARTLGALDHSGTAFASNPAGLAYVQKTQIGFMYTSHFGLANYNYLGLAIPFIGKSTAAINWIRFGVDDIPIRPDYLNEVTDPAARRDSVIALQNYPLETFNDVEDAIFISYARFQTKSINLGWRYSRFRVEIPLGINFKIIRKAFYNLEAYGIGVDIGGRLSVKGEDLFEIRQMGKINIGFAIRDVAGTLIYWNTQHQDEIRMTPILALGFEQPFERLGIQINLGLTKEYRYQDRMRYGIECIVKNRLSIRAGLDETNLTSGIGLNFKILKRNMHIDYSYLSHELGAVHRIGGGIEI